MEPILSLQNIYKAFGDRVVLNHVDLVIEPGEYVSIVGASGAGKSTLMNIIGLLDQNFTGTYAFNGQPLSKREHSRFRNQHLGFIFQQYNLIPSLTSKENILLPCAYASGKIQEAEQTCERMLREFGLEKQKDQPVNTLSGGEKQRIALIRSVIMDPEILLADEPTGNLDEKSGRRVRDFLQEMNLAGKTIIVVTHDLEFSNEAERRLKVEGGELHELS